AHGDAALAQTAAAELTPLMHRHGPIQALCHQLSLLEHSSGRWREMGRLPLTPVPTDESREP
ncbi:MAG TPA: hypothetical protein VET87_06240, partial [Rubrivivax sp.]|nr:hypothetical protein [Rubrivivax sp.]